jgi:hypothetical protein
MRPVFPPVLYSDEKTYAYGTGTIMSHDVGVSQELKSNTTPHRWLT